MESRNKPKLIRMENLRRVVQVLSFVAFLYLFVLTIGKFDYISKQNVLTSKAPIDTFFRIDPLLGLTAMIATRRIITVMLVYGLPIVLLTVLAGRFFCGWICPLGTALDATDTAFFRKRTHGKPDTGSRNIKYYVLAGMLIAAAFGSQLAYLMDPITIITRAFTFALFPIVTMIPTGDGLKIPYVPSDVQYFFRFNFFAAAVLIGILAANAVSRRYWCRNLCPLGALLGLLSRFSIVRCRCSRPAAVSPMSPARCSMRKMARRCAHSCRVIRSFRCNRPLTWRMRSASAPSCSLRRRGCRMKEF